MNETVASLLWIAKDAFRSEHVEDCLARKEQGNPDDIPYVPLDDHEAKLADAEEEYQIIKKALTLTCKAGKMDHERANKAEELIGAISQKIADSSMPGAAILEISMLIADWRKESHERT